jgi:hypothetical protein
MLQMYHFTSFLLKFKLQFSGEESFLLVECCFYYGNPGFIFTCISCIIFYHATQLVEIFHILWLLFLIYHNLYWGLFLKILITLVFFHFDFHSSSTREEMGVYELFINITKAFDLMETSIVRFLLNSVHPWN